MDTDVTVTASSPMCIREELIFKVHSNIACQKLARDIHVLNFCFRLFVRGVVFRSQKEPVSI